MSKRKTAKPETPQLPVLYVAERFTADNQVNRPDRITVKRFKAVGRDSTYYNFSQSLRIGDVTSCLHLISLIDQIVKCGGRAYSMSAIASTPTAALELLVPSIHDQMAYMASQFEGRQKTIDAIRARIEREAGKSKKRGRRL